MKTIKSVSNNRYAIELVQMESGMYRVCYNREGYSPVYSEPMNDLKSALYTFEIKIIDLEGN